MTRPGAEKNPNTAFTCASRFSGTESENRTYACADGAYQASSTPPQCAALGPRTRGGTIQAMRRRGWNLNVPERRSLNAMVVVLIALSAGMGACQRPLFSAKDDRTQYDRYLRSRSEIPPPYIEDEYGRRTPNLRERLSPNR